MFFAEKQKVSIQLSPVPSAYFIIAVRATDNVGFGDNLG